MRKSGISVTLNAEGGAIKKSDGKYEGSKKTQERVEAELKEKKEDEEWQKEKKEREDGWERQRQNHEEMLKKSGWGKVVCHDKERRNVVEWSRTPSVREEEEEEVDNIKETRFETSEDYGPLQPSPPHPATTSAAASLDVESASEEEEKKKKSKGKSSKVLGKGTKGLPIRAPSYAQLLEANRALEKKLGKKLEKERRSSKKRSSRKSESEKSERRRSSESDSSTVKRYEDGLLASPLNKSAMDAE